jgi:hypothetical protein
VILKGEEVHKDILGSSFCTFANNNWKYTTLNQEAYENCHQDSSKMVLEENGNEKIRPRFFKIRLENIIATIDL